MNGRATWGKWASRESVVGALEVGTALLEAAGNGRVASIVGRKGLKVDSSSLDAYGDTHGLKGFRITSKY